MSLPTPKYEINQQVFFPHYDAKIEEIPCPDCLGQKKWRVKTPANVEFDVECLTCHRFISNQNRRYFQKAIPYVRKLTIGSVQIDTASEEPIKYMCRETGIGSGSVYQESKLFGNETTAMKKAEELALVYSEETNKRRKLTDRDRQINHSNILDAKVENAKRIVEEGTQELENWHAFLDNVDLEDIKTENGYSIEIDTITTIVLYLKNKFHSEYL